VPQKPEDRNYRAEYDRYHGKPAEIKKRVKRDAARAKLKKAGVKVEGKDVHHVKPLNKGGTNNRGNLAAISVKKNRGFKRDAKNRPIT
jgi:hypothetical protein